MKTIKERSYSKRTKGFYTGRQKANEFNKGMKEACNLKRLAPKT
jgi:hypothetical protein